MPQSPGSPATDDRQKTFEAVIRMHRGDRHALIEVLHVAQKLFGHLSPDLLFRVSQAMDLPPSKVFGVASFYHLFTLTPKARHDCTVCLGTACYIKHGARIVAAVEDAFDLKVGEQSRDGKLSLNVARCVGSCSLAPLMLLDGAAVGIVEPAQAVQIIQATSGAARETS